MNATDFDIVILANGDFPSHAIPLRLLDEARFLVCCDEAGRVLIEQRGIIPDAIVGDGDSLPEFFKQKYCNIYHHVEEQDYNDLTKATRYSLSHLSPTLSRPRIAYIGCTGKREDHTIGNISLMLFYEREFAIEPVMITDYGTFTIHHGDATLPTIPQLQVSIFNIDAQHLTSEGLKWPAYAYKELWQGTLNEAQSHSISFHSDGTFIVYRTHEIKS